jgi:hypothetical protein
MRCYLGPHFRFYVNHNSVPAVPIPAAAPLAHWAAYVTDSSRAAFHSGNWSNFVNTHKMDHNMTVVHNLQDHSKICLKLLNIR